MKSSKIIKKIYILAVIITILITIFNTTYAFSVSNIFTGGENFIDDGEGPGTPFNDDTTRDIMDSLYNGLLIIGIIVAVIIGIALGIQFITGSVEQKSKIKESLLPYVVGCIVIFGAFGIWKLVIIILRQTQ